jgi:mono/diheme cytochrome c family protein
MHMKYAKFSLVALALGLPFAAAKADNAGPQTGTSPAVQSSSGATVYANVCQACHLANALGATGAATIPPLAGNSHLGAPAYPIFVVLYGHGAMPALGGILSDDQIAGVLNHVRQNFGNHFTGQVSAAAVRAARVPGKDYAGGF